MATPSPARRLLRKAITTGQSAYRLTAADDVKAIRAEIRYLARQQTVKIRTGIVDDTVLAVVLADSPLWNEPESVMRTKLTPPN